VSDIDEASDQMSRLTGHLDKDDQKAVFMAYLERSNRRAGIVEQSNAMAERFRQKMLQMTKRKKEPPTVRQMINVVALHLGDAIDWQTRARGHAEPGENEYLDSIIARIPARKPLQVEARHRPAAGPNSWLRDRPPAHHRRSRASAVPVVVGVRTQAPSRTSQFGPCQAPHAAVPDVARP
jgi:hypothetical protein